MLVKVVVMVVSSSSPFNCAFCACVEFICTSRVVLVEVLVDSSSIDATLIAHSAHLRSF